MEMFVAVPELNRRNAPGYTGNGYHGLEPVCKTCRRFMKKELKNTKYGYVIYIWNNIHGNGGPGRMCGLRNAAGGSDCVGRLGTAETGAAGGVSV